MGRTGDALVPPTTSLPSEGPSASRIVPPGHSGLTSLECSITREPWPTDLRGRRRYVGGGNTCWCGSRHGGGLAFHRLEAGLPHGPSAPGAYREGSSGGQLA